MRAAFMQWSIGAALGLSATVAGQYDFSDVLLRSQIDLGGFTSNPGNGNDCWGYVSLTGREYALMGLSNALAIVEITDPDNPDIVAEVPHTNSLWGDVKVYGNHAYVVNESGGGMDIIDLSNIDGGLVSTVTTTVGGLSSSHNVVINPDSGYLYVVGSNLNSGRLTALDLSNPTNPSIAGAVSSAVGAYCHDAQVVTYTSGPYAGQEIAFCANGGTGLDIYDVSNKGSMTRLSRTTYDMLSYCHQCWLGPNGQYLYVNDELDESNFGIQTRTLVFDVTDLANPVLATTFGAGVNAIDHNLYVNGDRVYEANYRSGLRIFDVSHPLTPVEVGYFDTYPGSDASGFDGAWSTYPFFPSGTVIVSDVDRGLFVLTPGEPLLTFEYPDGQPDLIDPSGDTLRVRIVEAEAGALDPATAELRFDAGAGFQSATLVPAGGDLYDAVFPATDCGAQVEYYIAASTTGGQPFTDPLAAPVATHAATSAVSQLVILTNDMETDAGWTVTDVAIEDGGWNRGVPVGGGDREDPPTDFDGSGACWLTDNEDGNSDVDGGPTILTTTTYDLSGDDDPYISYARWFGNDDNDIDRLDTEISNNGGGSWTLVDSVGITGGWNVHTFRVADHIAPTAQMQVRFSATDNPNDSVTEAGIDAFEIISNECDPTPPPIPGDLDEDGDVDFNDLLGLLAAWGPCSDPPAPCPGDVDNDGNVAFSDLLLLLTNWGTP